MHWNSKRFKNAQKLGSDPIIFYIRLFVKSWNESRKCKEHMFIGMYMSSIFSRENTCLIFLYGISDRHDDRKKNDGKTNVIIVITFFLSFNIFRLIFLVFLKHTLLDDKEN